MTEIQWLVNLMINHELEDDVKKLCIERIGEVEKKMTPSNAPYYPPGVRHVAIPSPWAAGDPYSPPPLLAGTQRPISEAQRLDMQETMLKGDPAPLGPEGTRPGIMPTHPPRPQAAPKMNLEELEQVTGGGNGTSIRGPNKLRAHR